MNRLKRLVGARLVPPGRRPWAARGADLQWIDGFVKNIRPHVFVRKRDNLLILMPNQAYHLNDTGIYLLSRTLAGVPIRRVIPREHQTEERLSEINDFFCDIRALVIGCLREGHGRRAVEQVPFSRAGSVLPVLSEIAVTYRCNLACRFCYAGCSCRNASGSAGVLTRMSGNAREGTCAPGEMTAREIEIVLRRIRHEAEVPSVSFTGGEPTVREDLPKLIRSAVRIGLRVNLITNGTLLTQSLARELKRAGLRSAQVSVEGPNAEVHDALTGVEGSFERTIRGIEALKGQGIYVHTHTTINRLNAEHIEGMPALAKSLGLPRLSMNMVMPCGSARPTGHAGTEDSQPASGQVSLRYREIGDLVKLVKRTARDTGIEFMWYSPTPYCMFNPIAGGLGGKACAACDGLLSVAPNGDVLPCSSLADPVGNILHQSFGAVWNSERALYYRNREYVPDDCRSCGHLDLCSGACPIYWDAFGCEEIALVSKGSLSG